MSTIAEIELPAAEFALWRTLSTLSDINFEIIRLAATGDQVMPYVRAAGEDLDKLSSTLEDDPSVNNVMLLDDLEAEQLYRMEWIRDAEVVLHMVAEQQAAVVEMHGQGDSWQLRVIFPGRESLSATHDFCEENELTFTIHRIYELEEATGRGSFGLTEAQYEALVTAAETGYFDVPRAVTMTELASNLGVSQQALSERLRRGHKSLIDSALRASESSF